MSDDGVQRRLAAVLAADVAGYTRLMEEDSDGTVAAWCAARDDVIEPAVASRYGRVVKLTGDGFLAEFPTVQAAVECAVAMQDGLAGRALEFRMGVHLGDIIDDGRDIHGEGVNVAARLEALAEPGGICLSGDVYNQVRNRLKCGFEDLGEKSVKNVSAPVRVYRVERAAKRPAADARPNVHQDIRFCSAPDGVQLAYAVAGTGPPLVKTANWLNHLEYDWESPVWSHVFRALTAENTLIRYDQRGNGLSDWEVEDFSLEAQVADLESVVDAAALDRFALLGVSQGCMISVGYAVRHPERVTRLVLYGGFATGRMARGSKRMVQNEDAMLTLIEAGWGQENAAFRQIFTTLFLPEGTAEQFAAFNELQRITTSPKNAVAIRKEISHSDASHLLSKVSVPTLVLHCRDEQAIPFELGRQLAAGIPGARFVALPGKNHLILEHEPAWPRFLAEVRKFLAEP
jgi:class 3 adenylate cyclase/pimeloyl-ACP methyl ester carboxylesterase